jgi:hypothetical protein
MHTDRHSRADASFLARLVRSETLHAALILAGLLVFFFSTPLARYKQVYYSSADLTQDFSLTKIEPRHVSGNKLMSDAVTQMQPWLMFNRDELRAGRVPLWNRYNGTGAPHLGNYQSAVFSPFSFPFYVLSVRAALLASAFLKLWCLGFFTFLFLKEIGARQAAALLGATAFMFSGHNVLLLSFPHVGALVSMPAGFYFVEKTIRRIERWYASGDRAGETGGRGRPRIFWPLAGLSASFAAALLAGNPEPFYFSALFVAAFALVRLFGLWWKLGRDRRASREVSRLGLSLCASVAIAVGLTAFQTLTFLEYLKESRVLEQRSALQTPLFPAFWPLMMFPDVIGNPSTAYNLSYEVPPPNYELTNTAYIGGLVVLLAALSLVFARRNRFIAFFGGAAFLWALYAYDFFGASAWFAWIPTLDRAPINRSQAIWLFALSISAALCIDQLLKRDGRRAWRMASWTAIGGAVLLTACLIGADKLIESYAYFPSPNHGAFLEFVPRHLRWVSAQFAAGCAAVALLWLTRDMRMRVAVALSVTAVVFAQTGWHFKDYNPVTENRFFFPMTPAVAELKHLVGEKSIAILTEDKIPPDSNLPYKLALVTNYDGMWVRDYDALFRDTFGNAHNWRPVLRGSERALELFGVEYVLAKWGWMNFESGMSTHAIAPNAELVPYEILPHRQASQIFTATKDHLQAVCVWLGTYEATHGCHALFRLADARSGRSIFEKQLTSEDIQADIYSNDQITFPSDLHLNPAGRPVLFRFDPIADSRGKQYRWTITCDDGTSAQTLVAWMRGSTDYKDGSSYWGKTPLKGPYLFDTSSILEDFEESAKIGDYVLYRYKKSLGKFHTVGGAVIAASDDEALNLPRSHGFDPRRLVVLSPEKACEIKGVELLGPTDNSNARLVKTRDSDWVYIVANDEKSLLHIPDEQTFLANKLKWDKVETISREEFSKYTVVDDDRALMRQLGMRTVAPDVPDTHPLEVIEDSATYMHVRVGRAYLGYLVIAEAHYPGWKARVNGEKKPLYRANYAFSAVELGRGENDVEIYYAPDSLMLGIWIGVASLVAGAVFFALSLRGP